jgi:hypothetical protein
MQRWLTWAKLGFLLLTGGCNNWFYFPSRQLYSVPRIEHRDVLFRAADGVELHGWFFPARAGTLPRGTVVQFHGNAGNLTAHYLSLAWLTAEGYALLSFDYRGYGRSGGFPTRDGLHEDAIAAISWATANAPRTARAQDIVLYGQSIGGAVMLGGIGSARDLSRVRAVVVEGSFHSYEDVAAGVLWRTPILFPFAGLGYALVDEQWSPAVGVARVSPIPLLVIHDVYDPVIPAEYGAALYRLARHPKTFWVTQRGGHIQATEDRDLRGALLQWLDREPRRAREARGGTTK